MADFEKRITVKVSETLHRKVKVKAAAEKTKDGEKVKEVEKAKEE